MFIILLRQYLVWLLSWFQVLLCLLGHLFPTVKSEIPNIPKLIPIIPNYVSFLFLKKVKKSIVAQRLHKYIYSVTIIAKSTIDILGFMSVFHWEGLLTDLKTANNGHVNEYTLAVLHFRNIATEIAKLQLSFQIISTFCRAVQKMCLFKRKALFGGFQLWHLATPIMKADGFLLPMQAKRMSIEKKYQCANIVDDLINQKWRSRWKYN